MVDFTNPTTRKSAYETTPRVDINANYNLLEENVMHKFASYNYVLTLSALSRQQLDNPQNIPTDAPHDIIARTGGIGQDANVTTRVEEDLGDATVAEKVFNKALKTQSEVIAGAQQILKKGRDIYFNSVSIDSYPRPNQFRKLMNYTKIEMTLEEPNGITFWEKCRAAAFNNGYRNHTTAPFLLTIEFKGFDSNGQEVPSPVPKRCYPIKLSRSELKMNTGSTTYTVSAFPWTEFAMINSFLYTRTGGSVIGQGKELNKILKRFADELNDDIELNEKNAGLRATVDKYEITADPTIGRLQTESGNQYPVTGPFGIDVNRFSKIKFDKNTSIVKILEDLVRQYKKYNNIEEILVKQAKSFGQGAKISEIDQYVSWYKIITTVKENTEFDEVLKTHSRVIRYHIKEFKVHILNFVKAGYGYNFNYDNAVRKVYDYIYTGNNLDILDLNVDYNVGYFNAILRKSDPTFINELKGKITKKIKSLFGSGTYEADELLPLHQYITTLNSESPNIQPEDIETGHIQGVADAQYDYLVNPQGDMVNVTMKIMGDPAFLGQDYAIPMPVGTETVRANIGNNIYDAQIGAFNFDNGEVIVKVNFKFPSDFDENTGLYNFNVEATPQFSGIYRVVRVESNLEQGQFTQTLTMARCLNQQQVTSTLNWSGQKGSDTEKRATGPSESFGLGSMDGA